MIRLKGGLEVTEKELKFWDNVPANAEIEALGITIARNGGQPPYIVNIKGYEEICLGKLGSSAGGLPGRIIGFVAFCIAGDTVTEFTIRTDGVSLKAYPRAKLTLKPEALRKMVE